jgi:4-hydroxy-tetrahydrodipicolinate synthase
MTQKTIELFVPAITPFADDLSVDHGRFIRQARWLLESGAHGLAPFGTTSEANSLTVAERRAALDALLEAGIPARALIPGTGCCAIGDTVELTRHATEAGCRGVLMLPPFYYKGVPEEGVFAAFARAVEAVGSADLRIYLYHIRAWRSRCR